MYQNELHKTPLGDDNDKLRLMLMHFVTDVLLIAPFVKRGDYEYEQEIRHAMNYKISDGILFRTNKNGNIIPYKEIEIPLKAIKKLLSVHVRTLNLQNILLSYYLNQKE